MCGGRISFVWRFNVALHMTLYTAGFQALHPLVQKILRYSSCQRNIERSPFSAWVHFAFAAAEAARRATGAAAIGARREAHRERRTVRGHLLRGNILPGNSGQFRAILGRQAVTGRRAQRSGRRFLVVRPLRIHGEPNGPADTGFARKTRPRCAWAGGRPPATPAHPVQRFSTGRTRLGRGSLASLSSCYAGRGGKNKTEGLQYLEPKGNVLFCSPGELLTLRQHLGTLR